MGLEREKEVKCWTLALCGGTCSKVTFRGSRDHSWWYSPNGATCSDTILELNSTGGHQAYIWGCLEASRISSHRCLDSPVMMIIEITTQCMACRILALLSHRLSTPNLMLLWKFDSHLELKNQGFQGTTGPVFQALEYSLAPPFTPAISFYGKGSEEVNKVERY